MPRRALVLGGGGPVGIAWESGLIAGLEEGGVGAADADLIVGTSAGSFVGAQLRMGRKAQELAASQLAAPGPSARPGATSTGRGAGAPARAFRKLMDLMTEAATAEGPAEAARRKVGAFALAAETVDESAFIGSFGGWLDGLPADAWPERAFACTAIDAETGDFVVWTAESHVGLARAVASSCAVPGIYPPITINGRRYIDGGMRSATNADIVVGSARVLVVSVTSGAVSNAPAMAERSRAQIAAELAVLRELGGEVELIEPDGESLEAFGPNLMDPERRAVVANAGVRQGRLEAEHLAEFWSLE